MSSPVLDAQDHPLTVDGGRVSRTAAENAVVPAHPRDTPTPALHPLPASGRIDSTSRHTEERRMKPLVAAVAVLVALAVGAQAQTPGIDVVRALAAQGDVTAQYNLGVR